jgi:hypothetical protein
VARRAIHFADEDFAGLDPGLGGRVEEQGEGRQHRNGKPRDDTKGGDSMWEHDEDAAVITFRHARC